MMINECILADSINFVPHLAAFDLMAKKRFSNLELDKLLVYLIDTVDSKALPFLAEQFDVLGFKGMKLATNESEQREIIKRAIELHRFKGTVWSIREALKSIGFGEAKIIEHANNHWAKFRVEMDLGDRPLSLNEIEDLWKMVNEYKNARSKLEDLSYTISFNNDLELSDELFDAPSVDDFDTIIAGGDSRHNGLTLRNGSRNYSKDADLLTIQII